MKASALRLIAVLLLGGCVESVEESELVDRQPPNGRTIAAPEPPSVTPAVPELSGDAAKESSPVDAEQLLALTLANAKATDKRVMIHLGAPW